MLYLLKVYCISELASYEINNTNEAVFSVNYRDINTASTVSGVTPLMAAVIGGQKQCVEDMLTTSARIDVTDFKGLTVYHYAVKHLPAVIDVSFLYVGTLSGEAALPFSFLSHLL